MPSCPIVRRMSWDWLYLTFGVGRYQSSFLVFGGCQVRNSARPSPSLTKMFCVVFLRISRQIPSIKVLRATERNGVVKQTTQSKGPYASHERTNYRQSRSKWRASRADAWGAKTSLGVSGMLCWYTQVFHTRKNFSENNPQFGHAVRV
jgi:hypothetical protein